MPDKFFLDTNIFVYSFDIRAKAKQHTALALIEDALSQRQGVTSSQVIQEFLNVALRKFSTPITTDDAMEYLRTVFAPLCEVYPSIALYEFGLQIAKETGDGFYDALIVAAAATANCRILFSEDLQNGRTIHGLTIRNPF